MLYRIVRPMKRKGSQNQYFRQRIPQDVLDKARGIALAIPVGEKIVHKHLSDKAESVIVSLGTSNPSEVKERQAAINSYLDGIWESLRSGPTVLSHKQIVALSGELYILFIDALEEDPGSPELWEKVKRDNQAARDGKFSPNWELMLPGPAAILKNKEDRIGGLLDTLLSRHSLVIAAESRIKLIDMALDRMDKAADRALQLASGDYSEDTFASTIPEWTNETKARSKAKISIDQIFEDFKKEALLGGGSVSTIEGYERTFRYLKKFLKHDDASKITPQDIVEFKNFRLQTPNPKTGRTTSPKTVRDCDLAALKSVFGWALNNKILETNPALGITVKVGKKPKTRENYFVSSERKAILTAANRYKRKPNEGHKVAHAKRWVPWICAYTGARVGEIVQLRKQDVFEEDGIWVFRITPEARSTKNKDFRKVPVHEHLVEQGLLEFVEKSSAGYLFLDVKEGMDITGKWLTAKNRLREFVRPIVPDKRIAPNHGWRHTFKTIAREIENHDPKVLDDITGHAPRTQGDGYGDSTLKAKKLIIDKFPRHF